jgi:D-amino peptidase
MNILLMTDIEGITGVDHEYMIHSEAGDDYKKACQELMLDTNAAIAGFIDGGADKVYVYDGHGKGTNFIEEMLDPRAVQLYSHNWHSYVAGGKIDAYAEVGIHTMAGTYMGFLEHTQSSKKWFDYKINGISCGEIIQGAAYVGAYGIPIIFASGDKAMEKEAYEFFGNDLLFATVKQALSRNEAASLPYEEARTLIYEKAKASIDLITKAKPYKIKLPAEITVTFQRTDYCDEASKKYERIDARTVRKIIDKIVPDTKVSIVLSASEADALAKRAGKNLPNVSCLNYNMLTAHALYYSEKIILTEESAKLLGEFLVRK